MKLDIPKAEAGDYRRHESSKANAAEQALNARGATGA